MAYQDNAAVAARPSDGHSDQHSLAESSANVRNEDGTDKEDVEETAPVTQEPADGGALEKQETNKSKRLLKVNAPSVNDASAVPNGGTLAWVQVLGSFFLFFNTWGIINTFGVYQTYYETTMLKTSSPAAIAWIGSIQAFSLAILGPLSGPIYDAGYFRLLIGGGSFLIVFGHMMLSLCTEYWQVFLAQGICCGLGAGLLVVPSVAILSTYFTTRLATATGLAAAGSSLGGVVYPVALYRMLPYLGFTWSTRILGFIALGTLIIANCLTRVRVLPSARRKMMDLGAFKEWPYALFVAGSSLAFLGLYNPMFYVEYFSISYGIADTSLSFYLLPIINAGSLFGRILPNLLADKTGPMNVIAPASMLSGVLAFSLIAVHSVGPLIVVCALYGFMTGTLVSLPPTVYVMLSLHNRGMIGTRLGTGLFVSSLGILFGTPVTGFILDSAGFTYVWVFGGVLLVVGGMGMWAARVAQAKTLKLFVKV